VLARVNAEVVKSLLLPEVRSKIEAGGMVLIANAPAEFNRMYQDAFTVYDRVIKEAGIKPE